MATVRVVRVVRLGLVPYAEALRVQQVCVRRHLDRPAHAPAHAPAPPNVLLLCEHEPVYTVGLRSALYSAEEERRLRLLGADFCRTNRGGLITFHGPGQLVCYPVLDLACFGKGVRWYVDQLEETVVHLCRGLGVNACRAPETGVWVRDKKICAIGIHCGRYITSHGLALNCSLDLSWFGHVVPCGLEGRGVTSLSQELGRLVLPQQVTPLLLDAFAQHFHCRLLHADPPHGNTGGNPLERF